MTRSILPLSFVLGLLLPVAAMADAYSSSAGKLAEGLPAAAKVAVLPFLYIGAGPGSRGGAVVSERLETELIKDGQLKVLERALMEKVLGELRIKGGGLTDEVQAGKAGRLLGADYVVTGSLFKKTGGSLEFNARVIETATGQVKAAVKTVIKEDWMEKLPEPPAGAGSEAFKLCLAGISALDKREFPGAAEFFTKAIALEENGACGVKIPGMAYMGRSMAYQNKSGPQDDPEPAPSGPDSGLTEKEQAAIKGAAGEYGKRLARYDALLRGMPDNAAAYFERGTIYAKLRRYRAARSDMDAAIKLDAGKPAYYYVRGYALSMLGLYDNALGDYDAALRLDPNFSKAYNGRGNIYNSTEQPVKALASYAKAIELNPRDPLAHANRARCLFNLERYDEALKDCDKAIKLDPGFAEAYYWRGEVLTGLKQYDRAIKDFDKVLGLIPGYSPAVEGRLEAYDRKNGKFEKYDRDRTKALELFDAGGD